MQKFSKLVLISLLTLFTLGVLAGCGSEKVNNDKNIRIGFFPNITHAQALVGKANGTFAKDLGSDTKIEWKKFNAGPAEIEALFAGEVDLGYIGPGPAVNGYSKSNGDLQIIAGATDGGQILVSRKDLVIKNLKDLSGKKIAVPQFGNTQDLSLRNLLQANGLQDTTKGGTVEIKQVENPDIKTLLEKDEIDAALVPEPWGSRLIKEAKANIVLDEKQVFRNGQYTTAVVVARKEFIQQHPDLVEKFLKAHVELTSYINNNPEGAKELVNKQIKELTNKALSKDVLDAAFSRLKVTNNPQIDSVKDFTDLSIKAGFIKVKPDLKNLFALEPLNKVLKEIK